MSLSSAGVGLRHLCTIQRDSNLGTPNAWGGSSSPDWQDLATVACNAWSGQGREDDSPNRSVGLEDRRISVGSSTDVLLTDRVSTVTISNGDPLWSGPMNIVAVLKYADHTELVLEAVI